MIENRRHASHPAVINRLKRAHGHMGKVIAMIEASEPCLAIAQQLQAVESAVANAKTALIEDHLDHCLDAVVGPLSADKRQELADIKKIAKYL
ncbi:MAG: metal-sensing transcriptional repressor [Roseibium sp.]|nr:metal-sensing transcriptional repressor [Roseibium sp.]